MSRYQRYFIGVILLAIAATAICFVKPLPLGLDIAGGTRIVLQVDPKRPSDWPKDRDDRILKMKAIVRTIQNRVKGLGGVTEPIVVPQNQGSKQPRLVVELPGVDPDRALETIKSTASLEFYYLRDYQNNNNPMGRWRMDSPQGEDKPYIFTGPRGEMLDSQKDAKAVMEQVVNYEKNQPLLTGKDLLPNSRSTINSSGQVAISIKFNKQGTEIFRKFTRAHVDDILAVFFDQKLLTAPKINEAIPSGEAEITGFSSLPAAKRTAEFLNAGALPVPLKVIAKNSVEPTLGLETVNKVLKAGIIGLLLVVLFMALYYRLPGIIADIAVCLYALFIIAIFKLIGATMSLAGIAALIISIGMAVDANILIFERLKEELRSGKTLRAAIDAGFNRAFTAIIDSNVCTAITCVFLLGLGTPSVQSFAMTLFIGVAISMFTAITVTRTILHLLVGWEWAQKPELYGLGNNWMANSQMNVIGKRNVFFALSAILILPGLFFLATSGLKKGIEFESGTAIQASFMKSVTLPEVRSIAQGYSPKLAPEVQLSQEGGGKKVAFIKTEPLNMDKETALLKELNDKIGIATTSYRVIFNKVTDETAVQKLINGYSKKASVKVSQTQFGETVGSITVRFVSEDKWKEISDALKSKFSVASIEDGRKSFDSVSTVEPTISEELTRNAILAVAGASLLIILYLTCRFAIGGLGAGVKFGVCAVIALLHDAAFILGLFAILGKFRGWETDSLFVTAVLTVIGFSVHDTIVVYDRIRENLRHRLRGESFEQLCNRSILQTFTRSINTSLTVVITLVALIIFGGPLLRHFYIALMVGIIIGTYSSIFNATPLVVVWEKLASAGAAPKKKGFEDKPIVQRDKPMVAAPPTPTEAGEEVSEADDNVDELDDSKSGRIKRKTTKKKRF